MGDGAKCCGIVCISVLVSLVFLTMAGTVALLTVHYIQVNNQLQSLNRKFEETQSSNFQMLDVLQKNITKLMKDFETYSTSQSYNAQLERINKTTIEMQQSQGEMLQKIQAMDNSVTHISSQLTNTSRVLQDTVHSAVNRTEHTLTQSLTNVTHLTENNNNLISTWIQVVQDVDEYEINKTSGCSVNVLLQNGSAFLAESPTNEATAVKDKSTDMSTHVLHAVILLLVVIGILSFLLYIIFIICYKRFLPMGKRIYSDPELNLRFPNNPPQSTNVENTYDELTTTKADISTKADLSTNEDPATNKADLNDEFMTNNEPDHEVPYAANVI